MTSGGQGTQHFYLSKSTDAEEKKKTQLKESSKSIRIKVSIFKCTLSIGLNVPYFLQRIVPL